jgi:phosphate transport system protein
MQADEQVPGTASGDASVSQTDVSQAYAGEPGEGHTSKTVDQSLTALRMLAVQMGGLVIDQVSSAVRSLLTHDTRLAETVVSREPLVNAYDMRLDRETLEFIALQQPVASDLRMVRALARTALELERVGDESKKIARFAQRSGGSGTHDPVVAVAPYLRHMAELSVTMLRGAVRAFDEGDAARARDVLARDRELDAEFATALRQLMSLVMQDQHFIQATIDTVFALKGLERIGDHAKNISEQVLYMLGAERDTP